MELVKKKWEIKCEMQMTAMIDVVFQLLIFFVLSFKIAAQEGDFNIKMPIAKSDGSIEEVNVPSIKIKMRQNGSGGLQAMSLNGEPITDLKSLRERIIGTFGVHGGPGSDLAAAEVELDCDYDLNYEHVIRAITAVSGFRENGRSVRLIEKIKFAAPHQPGA